jgi:hypothetical protein
MIRGRPFEPGNKLGCGRPRGSQNKRSARSQQLLEQYGAIMQKAPADYKGMSRLLSVILLRRPGDRPIQTGPLPMGSLKNCQRVRRRSSGSPGSSVPARHGFLPI